MRRFTLLSLILALALLIQADSASACKLHRGHACSACCAPCQTGPVCCPMESFYVGGYIPGDMIPPPPPPPPKPVAPPPTPVLPKVPAPPEPQEPDAKPAEKPEPSPADKPAAPILTPPAAEKPKVDVPAPVAPKSPAAPAPAEPKPVAPAVPAESEPAAPPAPAEKKAETPPKPTAATGPVLRVWTDSSGTHRVVARFVGIVDGDTVRLEQLDGTCLRVALDRLSTADQQYVSAQRTTLAAK